MTTSESVPAATVPLGDAKSRWKADIISGFLVFLIALPLCLAIANASCFPPVAGVITAIIGGLLTPWFSNSQLTIKGPAAGMIVIVAGCALAFGWVPNGPDAQWHAYRCTLAVGVAAGCIQIVLAFLRCAVISEFFPTTVVHGMLAAIGIIIISKQSHIVLGATPAAKEPLHMLAEIPHSIMHGMNPAIACIGLACLVTLFLWPKIRVAALNRVPGPLVVVLLSIGMAWHGRLALATRTAISLPDSNSTFPKSSSWPSRAACSAPSPRPTSRSCGPQPVSFGSPCFA